MKDYTQLNVWLKSRELAKTIYDLTRGFPREELFGLANQMRRAAVSIPSNLAEGCGRNHQRDSLQFFFIARGSLYELETQLYIALDQSYLEPLTFQHALDTLVECRKMLSGFIAYFQKHQPTLRKHLHQFPQARTDWQLATGHWQLNNMVEVQHLTKTFGTQAAVDDISFSVGKGEILGFLGPNGAGKSTTMKMALGYLPPSAGTIVVEGYDVQTAPLEVRRRVGYLPEHNPLYLDMYVHEYLEFIGAVHGLGGSSLRQRVRQLVDRVGLGREQNKQIGALSKGYRQRVGLAQALIHDPGVLILDEPTTGLDPNQIGEIRQLIRELGQDKTVIFSTHILPEVEALCSRAVIINRGRLVADSPVSELGARAAGETIIRAEFEQPIDVAPLLELSGIVAVETETGATYRIRARAGSDQRGAISRLAAAQGWVLLGLRQEEQSLEQVFKNLTKGGKE